MEAWVNKLRHITYLTLIGGCLCSQTLFATSFSCVAVDPQAAGHRPIYQQLTDQMGHAPAEMQYCAHDRYPKWLARWNIFEEQSVVSPATVGQWRRFASAHCSDQFHQPDCFVTQHVVVPDSHVVLDIRDCDISLQVIAEIHAALDSAKPRHEMREIAYVSVLDGGAWSEADYGYSVRLSEPPKFAGGATYKMVKRCADGKCAWHIKHGGGAWFGGDLYQQHLRRQHRDPLIHSLFP